MSQTAEILLWLFIFNLGTVFGAGIYEARLIIPLWFPKTTGPGYLVDTEAMRDIDSGRKFWAFTTTLPLTLLTIANLVFALQFETSDTNWWLMAAVIIFIERLMTFSFFIPNIIKLNKIATSDPYRANRLAGLWIKANYFRNGLTLVGWICAMKALMI